MNEYENSTSTVAMSPDEANQNTESTLEELNESAVPTPEGADPFIKSSAASEISSSAKGEQPEVVDVSGIWTGTEQGEDLSKFQMIASGFFPQNREPALTINGRTVGVNAAAARLFPDVDYMEILINPEDKKLAYKPCDEYNIHGYQWARTKNGKRYGTQRTGQPFVLCVCQMMGWNPDNRYRILGKRIRSTSNEEILLFDLKAKQEFQRPASGEKGKKRRSTILTGWNGTFGPTYDGSQSSLHLDTFDGYTVMSLKEKKLEGTKLQIQENPSEPSSGDHNES